jgi:hypothetical protein
LSCSCCAAMPAAAEKRPSSMCLPLLVVVEPSFRVAVQPGARLS